MAFQKKVFEYLRAQKPIFLSLVFLALTACTNPPQAKEGFASNVFPSKTKFLIVLPEDHKDGSTWQISETYDANIVQKIREVWHGPEKGLWYTMETVNVGETTVKFVKRKYHDTLEIRQFVISVAKR